MVPANLQTATSDAKINRMYAPGTKLGDVPTKDELDGLAFEVHRLTLRGDQHELIEMQAALIDALLVALEAARSHAVQ